MNAYRHNLKQEKSPSPDVKTSFVANSKWEMRIAPCQAEIGCRQVVMHDNQPYTDTNSMQACLVG